MKDDIKQGPTIEDKIVGANVRRIRALKRLSQTELGNALGLTFQQVQKYEKGTNRVSASRLVQIARYFGVSMNELFKGIELKLGKDQNMDKLAAFMAQPDAVKLVNIWTDFSPEDKELVTRLSLGIAKNVLRMNSKET